MFPIASRPLVLLGTLLLAGAGPLVGQAAIDPSVAPRAATLDRQGAREAATEMLGRYLATAPDDGRAWFQLGRFYLLDSRDWHLRGHVGEPTGVLYLDFAETALQQSMRLAVDSGVVFRAMVEIDRLLVYVEDSGWGAAREEPPQMHSIELPDYIGELGVNLLNSCPVDGILLTGADLEVLAAWYQTFVGLRRPDLLLLRPDLYAADSVYRRRMADALGADPGAPMQQALSRAAQRRPICLSPLADASALPVTGWVPLRLVRVNGPVSESALLPDGLSVTDLVRVEHQGGSAWADRVAEIYQAAGRYNRLLCAGILTRLGDRPRGACGQ